MLGRCSEPREEEAKGGSGYGLSVPRASAKQKGKRRETLALLWCHQESNRGHKDFQSFALPTELWHHLQFYFLGAEATRFELVVRLPVRQFSKLLVSATHPHFHRILLLNCTAKIIRFFDLCKYFALSLPTAPLVEHPPLTPSSPHLGTSEALIGKPRQGAQRDHTAPRPSYNTPPQAYKSSPLRARTLLSRLFEEETYLYEAMTLGKAEGSASKDGAS